MRYFTLSLVVAALLTATACTGKSDQSSSDQSTTTTTTTTTTTAPTEAATEAPSEAASTAPGDVPAYPGAVTEASGSNSNMAGASGTGTVMSTDDSFDKVYAWYQQHLPAGAEKTHTTQPPAAVFTIGDPSSGMKSVSITTSEGKTKITIGTVKTSQ